MSKTIIKDIFKEMNKTQSASLGLENSIDYETEKEIKKYSGIVNEYKYKIQDMGTKKQEYTTKLQTVNAKIKKFESYVRKKHNLGTNGDIHPFRIWTGNFWKFSSKETRGTYKQKRTLENDIRKYTSRIGMFQNQLRNYEAKLKMWRR